MFSFRLFKITLKKYFNSFIFALIGAIVPLVIVGAIAFCVINSLGEAEPIVKGKVAVVSEDGNTKGLNFAFQYVEQMKSTSEMMEFEMMDFEEAKKKLDKNEIIAIIYLPTDVVDSILYGQNIPATIYFSSDDNLTSVFLSEITMATAEMLASAQAGTYATTELYRANEMDQESLEKAWMSIDAINFNHVMVREEIFKTVNITMDEKVPVKNTGSSIINFYSASAILVFLLILGAPFTRFLQKENDAFYSLLKTRFGGVFIHDLIIFVIYTINVLIFEYGLLLILSRIDIFKFKLETIPLLYLLLNAIVISSFTFMISKISSNTFVYVLTIFFCGLLLPFIAGLIIPMAFIPREILNVGQMLPFYNVQDCLYQLLEFGKYSYSLFPIYCSIAFLIIGLIINKIKIVRAR